MPHQLRSSAFPSGLPEARGRDAEAIELGNLLSRRAASLITLAVKRQVLGIEENPAQSFLFQLHGRAKRSAAVFHSHVFEQCAVKTMEEKNKG